MAAVNDLREHLREHAGGGHQHAVGAPVRVARHGRNDPGKVLLHLEGNDPDKWPLEGCAAVVAEAWTKYQARPPFYLVEFDGGDDGFGPFGQGIHGEDELCATAA